MIILFTYAIIKIINNMTLYRAYVAYFFTDKNVLELLCNSLWDFKWYHVSREKNGFSIQKTFLEKYNLKFPDRVILN